MLFSNRDPRKIRSELPIIFIFFNQPSGDCFNETETTKWCLKLFLFCSHTSLTDLDLARPDLVCQALFEAVHPG